VGGESVPENTATASPLACALLSFLQLKHSALYPHRPPHTGGEPWSGGSRATRSPGYEALQVDPQNGTNSSKQLNRRSTGEQQRTSVPANKKTHELRHEQGEEQIGTHGPAIDVKRGGSAAPLTQITHARRLSGSSSQGRTGRMETITKKRHHLLKSPERVSFSL
jgi:hypothetical protein